MNRVRKTQLLANATRAGLILALGGCAAHHVAFTHAPPGTDVRIAMAKKAEAVPTPTPAPVTKAAMPSVRDQVTENIADFYTQGNLLMEQEKYPEAIKAYESAVKLDPTFYDAWNHLAICYQNTGQGKKAIEAFKKYKAITGQQIEMTKSQ